MKSRNHVVEILEARIAPAAAAPLLPTTEFDAKGNPNYVKATFGAPVEIHAGQVMTTGGFESGSYLMYVQKGEALVFFTDLNNNRQVDFNELTGISAGDGLSMISFVDIHGDVVTNLRETTVSFPGSASVVKLSLSDSDNNTANDDLRTGGDGRVLLNSSIAKIELRPLRASDVIDFNKDGVVDDVDALLHQAPTTTSIFGNIYAGKGFGTADGKGGLIVDPTNASNFGLPILPFVGSIRTGTAVNGEFFSFGASGGNSSGVQQIYQDDGVTPRTDANGTIFEQDNSNASGTMLPFVPPRGQAGGDIVGVSILSATAGAATLDINVIHAGDGGVSGRGGSVINVTLPYDDTAGYDVIAGNGGNGPAGGDGGSIVNFSDLGSVTGEVNLHTGNGGTGVTGAGGNGGNFTFGTFNVRGDIHVTLGDGGDGFTRGGNGASLLSGTITQADPKSGLIALSAAGTTHVANGQYVSAADNYATHLLVGTHTAINFNPGDTVATGGINPTTHLPNTQPDTFGDFVFTTGGADSQLIVELGDPFGGFNKIGPDGLPITDENGDPVLNTIALHGPRNAQGLVVADLNGDGHPDIAVGSNDAGSQMGIAVFLSQYDATGHFLGFASPRYSVLPQMATGDALAGNGGLLSNGSIAGYVESPHQISQISAGDYNGDGKVELAVIVTQYQLSDIVDNQETNLQKPQQTLVIMQPDVQNDYLHKDSTGKPAQVLTGQFYADYGTKGYKTSTRIVDPSPRQPQLALFDQNGVVVSNSDNVRIESSPVRTSENRDVIFVGVSKDNFVSTVDYSVRTVSNTSSPSPFLRGEFSLGKIDTNRLVVTPTQNNLTQTAAALKDFSIFDYDGNGDADLAAVVNSTYIVGVHGNGTGDGTQVSGDGTDQSGVNYGPQQNGQGGLPAGHPALISSGGFLQIRTAEYDSGAAIITLDDNNGTGVRITSSTFHTGPQLPITSATYPDPGLVASYKSTLSTGTVLNRTAFDVHYQDVANPITADPGTSLLDGTQGILFARGGILDYSSTGLEFQLGNGGNSLLGAGGTGGSFGSGAVTVAKSTPISTGSGLDGQGPNANVTGKFNLIVAGSEVLRAGHGGDGFTTGGRGGSIQGVNLQYRGGLDIGLGIIATAGYGGRGVSGAGGAGGSIAYNSFDTSLSQPNVVDSTPVPNRLESTLTAGAGGNGLLGGAGGSVIGNGTVHFDTLATRVRVIAGDGGDGVRGGGSGGNIQQFHATLPTPQNVIGSGGGGYVFGGLYYQAGNGGSAASGTGGAGGSVDNSSPIMNSTVDDTVTLLAGDGGAGFVGGAGGNLRVFKITTPAGSQSSELTAQAGLGGDGTGGNGGAGGSVISLSVQSKGTVGVFNSVLAGGGGNSSGATGGNGGSIVNLSSSTTDNSFAITAGQGGNGLYRGGAGGSVLSAFVDFGASTNKALVIAGQGGDAHAFIPNHLNGQAPATRENLIAYGGRAGVGGVGGSINGFTQTGGTLSHADLIAGNGGSTLNFGTFFDTRTYVGNGGSIANVTVAGSIGNVDPNVPIKSYNDIQAGQTIGDFVNEVLRTQNAALNDSLGNVGILVGAAGSNKQVVLFPNEKPLVTTAVSSSLAYNGSLINLTAKHLMSAVAGSVEFISAIRLVQGLSVPDSVLAQDVDKNPTAVSNSDPNVYKNYIDSTGRLTSSPTTGGALIDGIIAAKQFLDGAGRPIAQLSYPRVLLG